MREKKRIIQFSIEGSSLSEKEARLAVNEAVFSFLGELEASKASAKFVRWDEKSQSGFLKCSNSHVQEVIAALTLKKEFKAKKIAIRTTKLLGSIPKA